MQEGEIQYQPVNDPLYYRIIKRFLDLLLSVIALIVLSPVFLVTAIALVVDDPKGEPIFTQTRIGVCGNHCACGAVSVPRSVLSACAGFAGGRWGVGSDQLRDVCEMERV
jgi:hypothetical protein